MKTEYPPPKMGKNGPEISKPQSGPSYPNFSLRDNLVKAFDKEAGGQVHVDDEGTATIKWRCSGYQDQEYGKSIDFQILEIKNVQTEGDADKELDRMSKDDR